MAGPLDILALLTGQGVNPLAMGGGASPQQYPGNFEGPAIQTGPAPDIQPPTMIRPEDLLASPNPSQPRTLDQRQEGIRRMITDFTFSLGNGLSAASVNPRGRAQRTQAGIGAILQVPKVLQDQIEAKRIADQQRQLQTATALSNILNQQSQEEYRRAQDANADQTNQRIIRQNEEANRLKQLEIDNKTKTDAATLRTKGFMRNDAGDIVPVPRDQMSPKEISDLDAKQNLDELRNAQTDLAIANTTLAQAKADPNSPLYKDAQIKQEQAQRRLELASQNLGIRQQGLNLRTGTQTNQYYLPAVTADSRLATMIADAGPDFKGRGGSGQSDLQLLFNHIGMTLSAQRGTRVTEAEIQRAIDSRSLPETLMARWDAIKSGKFLSESERRDMVNNGIETRNRAWYDSRRQARLAGIDEEPEIDPTLPPLKSPGPANPNIGAPIVKTSSAAPAIPARPGFTVMNDPKGVPHYVKDSEVPNAPAGWSKAK